MTYSSTCQVCGSENVKTHFTFGKYVCSVCLVMRKTGRTGNSGMIYRESTDPLNYVDITKTSLSLLPVKKSHELYVKWFVEHYPKSKGIVGRQINYLIYLDENPIGIIGFASPPLNYILFNKFFGFTDGRHSENAKLFLNNNVFRIVESKPNLATMILKLARQDVRERYFAKYGDRLKGLVTFVEPPRTGSLYKADNWICIGETLGVEVKRRGENWTEKSYAQGTKKIIYGYLYKAERNHAKPILL